jgi:hypothetical protein
MHDTSYDTSIMTSLSEGTPPGRTSLLGDCDPLRPILNPIPQGSTLRYWIFHLLLGSLNV